jgi:hypothetical protein
VLEYFDSDLFREGTACLYMLMAIAGVMNGYDKKRKDFIEWFFDFCGTISSSIAFAAVGFYFAYSFEMAALWITYSVPALFVYMIFTGVSRVAMILQNNRT